MYILKHKHKKSITWNKTRIINQKANSPVKCRNMVWFVWTSCQRLKIKSLHIKVQISSTSWKTRWFGKNGLACPQLLELRSLPQSLPFPITSDTETSPLLCVTGWAGAFPSRSGSDRCKLSDTGISFKNGNAKDKPVSRNWIRPPCCADTAHPKLYMPGSQSCRRKPSAVWERKRRVWGLGDRQGLNFSCAFSVQGWSEPNKGEV